MEQVAHRPESRAQAGNGDGVVRRRILVRCGRLEQDRRGSRGLRPGAERQSVGAETGDGDERVARLHFAAVHHQPGNGDVARQRDVGQEARERHGAIHRRTPAAVPAWIIAGGIVRSSSKASSSAAGSCGSPCLTLGLAPLRRAASQVSMSSGGTSISRNESSITLRNTGADTKAGEVRTGLRIVDHHHGGETRVGRRHQAGEGRGVAPRIATGRCLTRAVPVLPATW